MLFSFLHAADDEQFSFVDESVMNQDFTDRFALHCVDIFSVVPQFHDFDHVMLRAYLVPVAGSLCFCRIRRSMRGGNSRVCHGFDA